MSGAHTERGAFDTFVGLEIHIQLDTRTKVFCGCRSPSAATPTRGSVRSALASPACCRP